ncbi:MAG: AmmeMemoRadiSam system protein B [Phycisphaerae bacterium]|nr:AmmeMemoRadiSam system protein B [Phycisphaerae bacterium]
MAPMKWHKLAVAMLVLSASACQADQTQPRVRPPECADDRWYPSDPKVLAQEIDGFLAKADPPSLPGKPAALIAPHAGIRYSGPIAAAAFKTAKGQSYKRVIVLGFSHAHRFTGASILPKVTAYATPLGNIPVDREACDKLLEQPEFTPNEQVHRREHSLEIELPFLQRALGDFRLVPILVGDIDLAAYGRMAAAMAPLVDDQTLIVASSDFTHYGRGFLFVPFTDDVQKNLERIDLSAADRIMALDVEGFLRKLEENGVGNPNYRRPQTICGRGPITLLMTLLNRLGTYKGYRLAYDTSGRMTNDWNHSVSYVALAFVKTADKPKAPSADAASETFTPAEREVLLRIARDAATRALDGKPRLDPRLPKYALTKNMEQTAGAFVTLKNHGRLRGCIGTIVGRGPLVDCVVDNAVNAATRDYRFAGDPVKLPEMKDITVEISVMSPLKPIDDPKQIVLGKHGVILTRGLRRSVYLPQVATETGWDLETFLSRLSMKAGLPADAWRQPGTRLEVFTAEVFGEPEVSHASK